MRGRRAARAGHDATFPDLLARTLAWACPLALYAATLAPTVTLEDSGSFITSAAVLGIAHPPGFPLWCLLARLFALIPLGAVAERVNLSSAVFASATCWLLYHLALRLTKSRIAALVAALGLAVSRDFWSQAVIAEVYALNALFAVLLIWLALRWSEERETRFLYALAFASGLALTNHTLIVLVIPAVWLWALLTTPRSEYSGARLGACALLFALGLSVYLYLPIRAHFDPAVNWGDPDALGTFWNHVRRASYFAASEDVRYLGGPRDVLLHVLGSWRQAAASLTAPLALLAILGLWRLAVARRSVALLTLGIFALHTVALNAYVPARFTRFWRFEHAVYYIPAHLMAAIWVAAGAAWILAALCRRRTLLRARAWRLLQAVGVAAAALALLWPLLHNSRFASRHDYYVGRDFAIDLMSTLPQGAGILPMGDTAVFACLYMKDVERYRTDIQILSPYFGWRGEAVSAVFAVNPPTDGVRDTLPWLRDFACVPFAFGYLYFPADRTPPALACPSLERPTAQALLRDTGYDPFADGLRTAYATYFVHLGSWELSQGREDRALASWAQAERLNPADPFVSFLLAVAYHARYRHDHRPRALLLSAWDEFDAAVDPAAARYYGVTKPELQDSLTAWYPDSPDSPPGRR